MKTKRLTLLAFMICVSALLTIYCTSSERNNPFDPGCTKNCGTDTPTATQFTVSFDWGYDDPTIVKIVPITIDSGKTLGADLPSAHERDGFTFDGWFDDLGIQYLSTTPINANAALTAKWTEIEEGVCIVTLYDDGTMIRQIRVVCGEAVGDSLTSPEKEGFTFEGWFDDEDTQYSAATTINADVTLTAKWTVIEVPKCVVTLFDDVIISQEEVVCGEALGANALTPPEKEGFTFDGWFDNLGKQYSATTPITADVTLTAEWSEIEEGMCVISLYKDGTMVTQIQAGCGEPIGDKLPSPEKEEFPFEKEGFTFDGWFTTEDGEGEEVTGTTVFDEDADLYARWTIKTYTITFNANGGSVDTDSGTTGDGWKLASLPTPEWAGYDFDGWFTTAETGGTEVTVDTPFSDNDTVYARWSIITFTVRLMTGADEVFDSVKTDVTTEYKITAPLPTPEKTGYDFEGWFTTDDDEGEEVTGAMVFDEDTDVYARWTMATYTITFDANGGSVDKETDTTGDGWKLGSLPTPERDGYDFVGWFTTPEADGVRVTADSAFTGNTTIYARWDIIKYIIRFNTGTSEVMDSVETDIVAGYKITDAPAPTQSKAFDVRAAGVPEGLYKVGENHKFDGWGLNGALVDFGTMTFSKDTTLTARWAAPAIDVDGSGNLFENAVDYVNDNVGAFVLVLSGEVAMDEDVEVENGLTVIGRGDGKIIGAADFSLSGSKVTFEDINITKMSVHIGDYVTLAGGASVDTLILRANSLSASHIKIAEGWTGNVGKLDLYTKNDEVLMAWWKGQSVVQAVSGSSLTMNVIERITLGSFICDYIENIPITGPNGKSKLSDSGEDIGKLVDN